MCKKQAAHVWRRLKESGRHAGPGFRGVDRDEVCRALRILCRCIPALEWGNCGLPLELEEQGGVRHTSFRTAA